MKIIVAVLLMLSSSVGLFSQESGTKILAHDDGVPTMTKTFMESGGTFFIMRFDPEEPVTLDQLIFYCPDTSKGSSFVFSVVADVGGLPGLNAFISKPMKAHTIGWNEIDLSEYRIQIDGAFFYQLSYDNVSRFSIGAEDKPPISRHTWDSDC